MQGLTTLKTLGQSIRQAERIETISERYRAATMSVLRVTFLSALVLELVGTLSTAVIAVQIGLRLLYGQIGFEQAFFILVVAPEFYLPLRLLGQRFHAGMSGISASRRIFEILEKPIQDQPNPILRIVKKPSAIPEQFTLSFEDVSLTYIGRQVEALAEVEFRDQLGPAGGFGGANRIG